MAILNSNQQPIIGWRSLVVTQVVNAVDADAQAFISAAGITNLTQAAAVSTLVNDLKTYGLWTKMKALYPMVGGTATSHKFNLKDPRDLDAAYRLVFNGGWTHTSTGALPNGTTGWADTKLIPSVNYNVNNNSHVSFYSRTNSSNSGNNEIGCTNTNVTPFVSNVVTTFRSDQSNKTFLYSNTSNGVSFTDTNSLGFYISNRINTQANGYKNGVSKGSNTVSDEPRASISIVIGANNANTGITQYSSKESAFASIGDGLTDTEATNFYNSVQKFNTTLGRQIGSPIVSDTDAQAFINAAGLTDLGQANAVNTLVVDLKAAGVWTKMKALYPFVGGTATTHKWNLKDPRDLDAAFRLVFNGGWVHSSTGAKPNGSNGYADTYLIPFNNLTLGSFHHSVYSRTTWSASGIMGGCNDSSTPQRYLLMSNSNGTTLGNIIFNTSGFPFSTPINNTRGLMMGNRISTTTVNAWKDGVKVFIDSSNGVTERPTIKYYIGARNNELVAAGFDNKEYAFYTIGDSLTDADAAAFYTAVQKYQTTLGRQIGTPVLADGQTAGLLETYSGAAAAYSLRKLRTGYVGNAIRVRRSSDNSEQNIAFDASGNLDTTSLLAFVGSGNGFVTTWYDQSGNGSNLIQTTAANQARIVYSGVLETLNGKPALVTNYNYSNSGYYKATYASTINGPATMFNIGSNVATPGSGYLWDGLNTSMYAYSYNNTWMRIGGSAEFALTGYSQGITTQRIINAIYNSTSSKLRINNGTYATGNTGTIAATGLTLGGAYNGSYLAPAYNQEHIVYPTNQESNATGINTNINAYYSIY